VADDDAGGIKDVTVTSFGRLIASLLAALIGLYALSFWSDSLRATLIDF
jgi:hypothetical protein